VNRTHFFLLLSFLCLFPFLLAAQNASDIKGDKFEETGGRGLAIRTNPIGVKVFIDNVERGLTPINFDNLLPGEYSIRLNRDGYRDRLINITLPNNSRMEVSIEMEQERGLALVTIRKAPGSREQLPFNPQIITGSSGEESSLSGDSVLLELIAGYRTIRVRAFGWEDASATALISDNTTTPIDIYMKPAAFKLEKPTQSRKRFNPKDSNDLGITEFRFEVTAPGSGTITVLDKNDAEVYKKPLEHFSSRLQSASWDGRNSLGEIAPEGKYTVLIEAAPVTDYSAEDAIAHNGEISVIKLETEINYSYNIFPLSLSGGIPGLIFAALPYTLAAKSFQIEGGINFGKFSGDERAFSSLPFEIGFRVSPVKKLEISAVFNANPHFDNSNGSSAGWGISSSIKYNILQDRENLPLSLAAGFSYAYARENGEAPLSPGKGIGLYLPLSLEIRAFSLVFAPSAFWRGPEKPAPELLLGTGVFYRGSWINAGLSMRPQINFSGENGEKLHLFAGAEAHFYPPPSNLVFSFRAGVQTQGGRTGGFGGLGIGVIF